MSALKKSGLFFLLSVALYSCYRHNAESVYPASSIPGATGCDTTHVSFDSTISPILLQNCAITGCHASSSATGGYVFDNYTGVKTAVLNGRLVGAVTHAPGYAQMPKDKPMLDDCQIALITSWVNQGAQNN